MPFPTLFAAEKDLAHFPGWGAPEQDSGYCWFDAPLLINGVVEAGFVLRGGCFKHVPDGHVTFELKASGLTTRRIPLARIEWRSLTGGHSNKRRGSSPWSGKRVADSHHHAFDLNWLDEEQRMRRHNLPIARDIEEELDTFESLTAYVGKCFNIKNMEVVTRPPWEYSLFDYGK